MHKLRIVVPLLVLLVLVACTMSLGVKPWAEQTSKERLTWIMGVYNSQDRDYRAMAQMTNLTDTQKSMMVKKKAVMTQLYPMIDAYRLTVESGGTPSKETEQTILNMLNQLQSLGG